MISQLFFVLYSCCSINFIRGCAVQITHLGPAATTWNPPQGGSVASQIPLGSKPLKFVVTGDGSEASLMQLSAGALACIQDDGCFTLVCGDSSLCLCLTKCQQVSYSEIWQEIRRVWLHILQLPYCVADLHTMLSHCNPSVSAFNIWRQDYIIGMPYPNATWIRNYHVYG